ncbi:MAG: type II secretion system minor pseudopilin GspK [Pseudomonadota bacterium]|nr:type II secretion system minor pseudopilin GspK [Pseudomonadota bacterium]
MISPQARARQSGAAIVLAMMLAAFAAVVAASVLADQQRWTRNVEHRRDQVQAQATAMAGLQWAQQILYDDARTTVIDHLGETWALRLPPIPLDNGEVRGAIVDAQSRLNLNGLGDDASSAMIERTRLARLFAQRGAPALALASIADWVDRDGIARDNGAEDAWYRAQTVAILPPNAPVPRVSELAIVRHMSYEALASINAFVTTLPPRTPLNVNTASPEVLATVIDDATAETLAALVATRAQKPFATVADFRARLPQGAHLASEEMLDVKSRFFEITVEVRQGTSVARARALVRRDAGRWPAVEWQVVE